MRKVYIFGLISVAVLIIGIAIADEIKFSTYYPAPYGIYREFDTTGKTCLATDEWGIEGTNARVGIGTTSPGAKLDIRDDTTEIAKFHSSGIMDLSNQSSCRAYRGSGGRQSITQSAWTKMDFSNKGFDKQTEFDLTTDCFTATKDGLYLVSAQYLIEVDSQEGSSYISIYKNGSNYQERRNEIGLESNTGWGESNNIVALVPLSAGDNIEIYVFQTGAATREIYDAAAHTNVAILKLN